MENQLISGISGNKTITLFTYILIACSIISCLARPDYNILIGFFILFRRGFASIEKVKILIKISIHILIVSFIFDIFWILRFTGKWTHREESSELWRSLSLIHNLSYFIGLVEFILKLPIGLTLYKEFTNNIGGQKSDLFNLKYSEPKN